MRRLGTNYPTREIGRPMDTEAIKRSAFENQGIVVAKVDDPRLSWIDREELKRIGTKLYGRTG
ncbi:MAG: hypothetical protein JWR80_10052 [Bradyrhizobium sp.]|nr:hypothetical protein [Bradyrhizobium sp.]